MESVHSCEFRCLFIFPQTKPFFFYFSASCAPFELLGMLFGCRSSVAYTVCIFNWLKCVLHAHEVCSTQASPCGCTVCDPLWYTRECVEELRAMEMTLRALPIIPRHRRHNVNAHAHILQYKRGFAMNFSYESAGRWDVCMKCILYVIIVYVYLWSIFCFCCRCCCCCCGCWMFYWIMNWKFQCQA